MTEHRDRLGLGDFALTHQRWAARK
jgi:hypothetical protein